VNEMNLTDFVNLKVGDYLHWNLTSCSKNSPMAAYVSLMKQKRNYSFQRFDKYAKIIKVNKKLLFRKNTTIVVVYENGLKETLFFDNFKYRKISEGEYFERMLNQ